MNVNDELYGRIEDNVTINDEAETRFHAIV